MIYRIDCSFNFFEIASAHFVGKFTHTHKLAIFNLVQLSYILSIVLLYVLSVRQKVPKNWAVVYGIRCFLCSQIANSFAVAIFFGRFAPRPSQLVAMLGAVRTRCAQTSYRLFPSIARLLTVPPNAALSLSATNYLCNENSLIYIADFSAYNGNIKEKPAVSKSQRKSLLFGGHCARYVQTQYGNYLFLKLPYAVRSAAPDKQQKGLKWQVCDGRGMLQSNSRAEGTND